MGRFTKRLIGGLTAALMLVGGAFADLVDDLEGGTNENKWGGYWYYYVSSGDDTSLEPTITNAGPADEYGPMSFVPFAGGYNSDYSAAIVFTGLTFPDDDKNYPEAGMGTQLTSAEDIGIGTGFNSVNTITWWAKADKAMVARFKVETTENRADNSVANHTTYNAYSKLYDIETGWKKFTTTITPISSPTNEWAEIGGPATVTWKAGDLAQDAYWGLSYTFKRENITKLAWSIQGQQNTSVSAGTFQVDDVDVPGYTFIAADMCVECVGAPSLPTNGAIFSNFETTTFPENDNERQNGAGYYWYYYNDVEAGGSSTITGVLTIDEYTNEEVLDVVGNGNGGNGVAIEFTKGAAFSDGVNTIQPFVGIGTGLYDVDIGSGFYNATADGTTAIYFEYKTNVDPLVFEIEDALSSLAPDNKGEVYYVKLPGNTGDAWKGATIPFSKLQLPTWAKERSTPLDLSALAKLQFKHQGGGNGYLNIDNVFFIGSQGNFYTDPNSVRVVGSKAKATGLRATYSRGVVGVNWNAAQSVASGKVSLVNVRGRVVASAPIKTSGSRITANLGSGTIPTGMYFVRVNAKDVNGKKIVQQAPLSIVK